MIVRSGGEVSLFFGGRRKGRGILSFTKLEKMVLFGLNKEQCSAPCTIDSTVGYERTF